MPYIAIDIDISGQGTYDTGTANNMLFWETHLRNLGPLVRVPEMSDTDHILRAGFITWGDENNAIDGTNFFYWREPVWIPFVDYLYTPNADNITTTPNTFIARWFRWSLSPGTDGHLYGYAL